MRYHVSCWTMITVSGFSNLTPTGIWFITKCSKLTERFRYTPESVFDTFPWPQTPTAKQMKP